MQNLIEPHGSKELKPLYINDNSLRKGLIEESKTLKKVILNSSAASCAVMLGAGYFTPLLGFMDKDNSISVAKSMKMVDGLFWPIPIMNLNESINGVEVGDRIALLDPNIEGNPPLAIQTIESIEELSENEIKEIAENVFGTNDDGHPGVKSFLSSGRFLIAGHIQVLNYSYFPEEFPNTFATASEIRKKLQNSGWVKTVAFQTRNPMHRAHEELCKMALDRINADGVLIHMTLGKLKEGDIPGDVRDKAIRKMVELYFAPNYLKRSSWSWRLLWSF